MPDPSLQKTNNSVDWGESQGEGIEQKPKFGEPAYVNDRLFYRVIAFGLVGVAGLSILGSIVLSVFDRAIPESVVALGSASIGALAGVLASQRK